MKIRTRDFRVPQGARLRLHRWPTRIPPVYTTKGDYESILASHVSRMSAMQELLYASDQYTLLIIFQGMDTSGKDGVIKHVMSGVNPQGCRVTSFKHPSATELQHDFLWRTVEELPERGCIGIFNRSYYEDVLIVRVHPELLRAEGLPDAKLASDKVWKGRYRSVVELERHLRRSGTRIIKFFLHLSKEEQRKRLLARLDDPEKTWKFNVADIDERNFWPNYMDAYERCLGATSTKDAPWYIVPADDKQNARLIVSQVIVETLEKLDRRYPVLDDAEQQKLLSVRTALREG
jgi:PPK2 family polyphosphate:nucleotide phosphotransferase